MKKFLIIMVAAISSSFFIGCDSEDEFTAPNYVALQTGPADIQVELGGNTSYDVNVYTANVVSADRTFDVLVRSSSSMSPDAYTLPETVIVPGGTNEGVFTVAVEDQNFSPNGESLIIGLGQDENLFTGEDFRLNVSLSCDNPLVIDFVFDGYASETTWNVKDASGNTILEGGDYTDGTATTTIERCLPDGDYSFTVFDAYGDGLTYPEEGSVSLSFAGEELVLIPGAFGEEATEDFTLGSSSNADESDDSEGDDMEE